MPLEAQVNIEIFIDQFKSVNPSVYTFTRDNKTFDVYFAENKAHLMAIAEGKIPSNATLDSHSTSATLAEKSPSPTSVTLQLK